MCQRPDCAERRDARTWGCDSASLRSWSHAKALIASMLISAESLAQACPVIAQSSGKYQPESDIDSRHPCGWHNIWRIFRHPDGSMRSRDLPFLTCIWRRAKQTVGETVIVMGFHVQRKRPWPSLDKHTTRDRENFVTHVPPSPPRGWADGL